MLKVTIKYCTSLQVILDLTRPKKLPIFFK
jgi:hypothetical protein